MEEEGSVRVMRRCEPREVKKRDDGRLQVVLYDAQDNQILEVCTVMRNSSIGEYTIDYCNMQ